MGLYTKLLIHADQADGTAGTDILDSEAGTKKTITCVGGAQVDTAQYKDLTGSTGSILFDGAGDYCTLLTSADWQMGTGDFTYDFWVRWSNHAAHQYSTFFDSGYDVGVKFFYDSTANLLDLYVANGLKQISWSATDDTWYHIAVVRASGTIKVYVNGTQVGTDYSNSNNVSTTQALYIGAENSAGADVMSPGWIDELRISKGIARWTANFTPPTIKYASEELVFNDSVSSSDIFSRGREFLKDFPDTITLSDLLIKLASYKKSPLDTINLTDLINKIVGFKRQFPDAITLRDLITVSKSFNEFFNETITLGDKDFVITYTDKDIIEISADPQIQPGSRQGQTLSLQYVTDYPKLRLIDGRGLSLFKEKAFTMNSGSIINFVYDTANQVWCETSRMQDIYTLQGEG
jgi:hypothetical protein